jgi:hypothetical protein
MTMLKTRRLLVLASAGAIAACSDGTGPNDGAFDAQSVQSGLAVIERAANAQVLGSLRAVSRSLGDVGASAAQQSWSPGLEQAVMTLSAAASQTGSALIPVMRSSVLGKTFVWDPSVKKYVPDPARTGAPSNGVRFILYDVDPNENPLAGSEIGYADLTDERRSSASTAGIRLEVVTGGVIRLAYSFDLTGSLESAKFDVFGYITDGSDRLDFSIKTSQQLFGRGGKATLEAKLVVAQEDLEVTAKVAGNAGEEDGDGEVDLTIRSKLDEIVVDAETVRGELEATFTVNGQLLATATGNPKSPVLRGDGGRDLTDEETQAIGAIVEMAGGVFTFVSELLQPAGVLLLIALGIQ